MNGIPSWMICRQIGLLTRLVRNPSWSPPAPRTGRPSTSSSWWLGTQGWVRPRSSGPWCQHRGRGLRCGGCRKGHRGCNCMLLEWWSLSLLYPISPGSMCPIYFPSSSLIISGLLCSVIHTIHTSTQVHDGSNTPVPQFIKDPDSLCSTISWRDEEDRVMWVYKIQVGEYTEVWRGQCECSRFHRASIPMQS